MRTLTARERRVVAIGILVALFALAWLVVIAPLAGGFADRAAARETLTREYEGNARVIDSIQIWKHQVQAQQRSAGSFAFAASNATLAAQLLQSRLTNTVTAVGGTVRASGPQDTSAPGMAEIRADAELTPLQLYQVLKRLESEEPYVVVEYLSVAADRAFQTGHVAPMAVRFRIAARFRTVRSQ